MQRTQKDRTEADYLPIEVRTGQAIGLDCLSRRSFPLEGFFDDRTHGQRSFAQEVDAPPIVNSVIVFQILHSRTSSKVDEIRIGLEGASSLKLAPHYLNQRVAPDARRSSVMLRAQSRNAHFTLRNNSQAVVTISVFPFGPIRLLLLCLIEAITRALHEIQRGIHIVPL